MKILSYLQSKLLIKNIIYKKKISFKIISIKAAIKCFKWLRKNINNISKKKIVILCGVGNNGKYGYNLFSFLLKKKINVECYYIINVYNIKVIIINIYLIYMYNIIIDSIFGIYIKKYISNKFYNIIKFINKYNIFVISLETPSGLSAYSINKNSIIFKSNFTLTFNTFKLIFFNKKAQKYIGKLELINLINNINKYINNCNINYIDVSIIKNIFKIRNEYANKDVFGNSLLIGGSYYIIGSIVLCALGCIKSGVGKVTVYTPYCVHNIIQSVIPEIILHKISKKYNYYYITDIKIYNKFTNIGIGPGLKFNPATIYSVSRFLRLVKKKVNIVIDADAINIVSMFPYLINFLPKNTIFTPHIREFRNMIKYNKLYNFNKINCLKYISNFYKSFIILKGKNSTIISPNGDIYINSSGNNGLATAGSGDILTGIIVGLLTQGYNLLNASILGIYIHGLSGDICSKKYSKESTIGRNIITNIGKAYIKIYNKLYR